MKQLFALLILNTLFLLQGCSSVGGNSLASMLKLHTIHKNGGPSINDDGTVNFQWKDMIPAYFYYNPNVNLNAYVTRYISSFYREEWKSAKNDEFEINKSKTKHLEEMKKLRDSYDPNRTYVANVTVYFGDYNFEKHAFPLIISPSTKETRSLQGIRLKTRMANGDGFLVYDTHPFPTKFKVSLSAANSSNLPLSEIPMKEDVADRLIKSRKDYNGIVRRSAVANIKFKITGIVASTDGAEYTGVITGILYKL